MENQGPELLDLSQDTSLLILNEQHPGNEAGKYFLVFSGVLRLSRSFHSAQPLEFVQRAAPPDVPSSSGGENDACIFTDVTADELQDCIKRL